MNHWYLGTIGFSYRDWVGPFYPTGITQRGYLPYYCKYFSAVELNTTFHSIPRPSIVQSWADSTPIEFRFCLKTPRRITHELGLLNTQGLMFEFLESLQPLGEKCGPILIQLPPKFSQANFSVVENFLQSLPQSHRYAIEFRNQTWFNQKTTQLLTEYQVGWTSIDYPNFPGIIFQTTDFLYIRWIGVNNLYHHHTHERVDKTEQLKLWLEKINTIADNVENIYGFFNNDYAGFAAGTCLRFKNIAGFLDQEKKIPYQDSIFDESFFQ